MRRRGALEARLEWAEEVERARQTQMMVWHNWFNGMAQQMG